MRITILQFSNGAFCANRNVTATGGSWPRLWVRGRALLQSFGVIAWVDQPQLSASLGNRQQTVPAMTRRARPWGSAADYLLPLKPCDSMTAVADTRRWAVHGPAVRCALRTCHSRANDWMTAICRRAECRPAAAPQAVNSASQRSCHSPQWP